MHGRYIQRLDESHRLCTLQGHTHARRLSPAVKHCAPLLCVITAQASTGEAVPGRHYRAHLLSSPSRVAGRQ